MRLLPVTIAFALGVMAGACGGGGGGGVTNPPPGTTLGSIVPAAATINLSAGQRQAITMQALDANNQPIAGASGYAYSSGTPAIAVVSTTGQVTALSAGAATITVSLTLGNVTKTATVTVQVTGQLPTTATVAAGGNSDDFTPNFVAIARGGTVTWTFGERIHNVEYSSVPGAPGNIGPSSNTTVARTFGTGGTFGYICTLHANQNGTVIVP
ncbi:MAG: Ig-like domain-containing protein [Cytophagaceae bacterium]|nr:Ig-like domain-containing protein [Gemmatimonadaceae bacterium]